MASNGFTFNNNDCKQKGTARELQNADIKEAIGEQLHSLLHQVIQLKSTVKQKINALTHRKDIKRIAQFITLLQEKVLEQGQRIQFIINEYIQQGFAVNAQDINTIMSHHQVLEVKSVFFEDTIKTLHSEIERCNIARKALEKKSTAFQEKLDEHERGLLAKRDVQNAIISELDNRVNALEVTSYDGTLIWKIPEWSKFRRDAISGKVTSIYSPHFFNGRTGYRMCARLYPNGDGIGKNTHISIFFVVVRGFYDALLYWPFDHRVTFMLLDQNNRDHVIDSFRPDPSSSSFKRPTTDMNIASGCPLFMPLSKLDDANAAYVTDDVIFIKVIVESSGRRPGSNGSNISNE